MVPGRAPLEETGCPLCGTRDHPVAIEERGWLGRRCSECAVIYISPRPAREATLATYQHDAAETNAFDLCDAGVAGTLHATRVLRLVARHHGEVRGHRLLEIGPGAGFFLSEAQRQGALVSGIEPNALLAGRLRQAGMEIEEHPLGATSFAGRRFDVVFHRDVLSHLHDPVGDLRAMHQCLADNGLLIFETGNVPDVLPGQLRWIPDFQYPDHLHFFGEAGVRRLLTQTGFELISLERFTLVPEARAAALMRRWMQIARGGADARDRPAANPGVTGRARKRATGPATERATAPAITLRLREARRWIRDQILHRLRYDLGRQLARAGDPMTLLFTARRN